MQYSWPMRYTADVIYAPSFAEYLPFSCPWRAVCILIGFLFSKNIHSVQSDQLGSLLFPGEADSRE